MEGSSANGINSDLFRTFGGQSEMMATFCKTGLKYRGLVERKKFDPWSKWYKEEEFEVFPGKVLKTKCLHKSIY